MAASPYDQGADQAHGGNATNYALYQASTDPLVSALATMLDKKLGGGQGIFTDLINVLATNMGVENGSVTAAASIQAGMQRIGGPAAGAGSGIGMINGRDFISAQAASALQDQMKNSMFNKATGVALPAAHNMNMSEIGRLSGHLISSGALFGQGPAFNTEMLTKESIQKKQEAAKRYEKTTGDRSQLDEAMRLVPGEYEVKLTPTMKDAWDKKLKEGANTMRYIKDILGSEALKDLAGSSQLLLGSDFATMKPGEARGRISQIESTARLYHNGNVRSAAASHVAAIRDTAGFLAPEGTDPDEATRLFGGFAGSTAGYVTGIGMSAGSSNVADIGMGVGGRAKGTAEVQRETASDMAAYAEESSEAVALMHVQQTYGNSLSQETKDRIKRALADLGNAGDTDSINAANGNIENIISDITGGGSSGSVLGDPTVGGTKGAISQFDGNTSGMLGGLAKSIHATRNQSNLRSGYENDATSQNIYGLNSDDMGELGMGAANLSKDQFNALQDMLNTEDYSDKVEKNEKLFTDPGVLDALKTAGVDVNRFQELVAGRTGGEMTDIRGKRTRYSGSGNFQGAGDKIDADKQMFKTFIEGNQGGLYDAPGDPISEIVKGLSGGTGVTTRQIMDRARKGTDGQASGLMDFGGSNGKIDPTDRNIEMLKKAFGDDVYKMFGSETNDASLKESLGDENKLTAAYKQMQERGLLTFDKDRTSFLSNGDSSKWSKIANEESKSAMIKRLSGKGGFKFKEGESEAEGMARMNKHLASSFERGLSNKEENGKTQVENLVGGATSGNKGDSDMLNYMIDSGALWGDQKERLSGIVQKDLDDVNKRLNSDGFDRDSEEGQKLGAKQQDLYTLKDKLGGGGGKQNVNTMTVTNMTVINPFSSEKEGK